MRFHFDFYCFFRFLDQIFVKNFFCLNQISLSRWWFVHVQLFDIDFQFFFKKWSDYVGNGFPNSLIVRSRAGFCLSNESFCTSGLVLLCLFFNSHYFLIRILVLHKSRFLFWLLTYLTHSFNWIDSKFFHALNYAMKWIRSISKEKNQKKRDKPIQPGH